jgi:hypothetical protein
MIEFDKLNWLLYTPASDLNFKNNLKTSNIETIREAINIIIKQDMQIVKLSRLNAEYRRKIKVVQNNKV